MQHLYATEIYWFAQQNETGLPAKQNSKPAAFTPTGDPKHLVIEYNPIDGGHFYKLEDFFGSVCIVATGASRALASGNRSS
jgi:hypothetical protein